MKTEWEGRSTPNTQKASGRNENDLHADGKWIFCAEAEPASFWLWAEQ